MPWDHINYFEGLEVFVNNSEDSLRKMTFNCMDHNSDGYISEIDLWMLMRTLNSDIFVTVVSKDVITLVNLLHAKKIERGIADPIENRMKKGKALSVIAIFLALFNGGLLFPVSYIAIELADIPNSSASSSCVKSLLFLNSANFFI